MDIISNEKINEGLKRAVTQILNILPYFTDRFPKAYSRCTLQQSQHQRTVQKNSHASHKIFYTQRRHYNYNKG